MNNLDEKKEEVFVNTEGDVCICLWFLPKKDAIKVYEKIVAEINMPAKITGYRDSILMTFVNEHCQFGPGLKENATSLYNTFRTWYQKKFGPKYPSQTWFGKHLVGFPKSKNDGIIFYNGITLKERDTLNKTS